MYSHSKSVQEYQAKLQQKVGALFWGSGDKEEKKKREADKRLDELEENGACCVCESDVNASRIEIQDFPTLQETFDSQEIRGFICSVCHEVAFSAKKQAPRKTDPVVNSKGHWTCLECSASNVAFAKSCDKCSAKRPELTQGVEFIIAIPQGEEIGLQCTIEGGAVSIDEVRPGSPAERAGVQLGILTLVEGKSVHCGADLRKAIERARAMGKKEIKVHVVTKKRNAALKMFYNLDQNEQQQKPQAKQAFPTAGNVSSLPSGPKVPPPQAAAPTSVAPPAPPPAAPTPVPSATVAPQGSKKNDVSLDDLFSAPPAQPQQQQPQQQPWQPLQQEQPLQHQQQQPQQQMWSAPQQWQQPQQQPQPAQQQQWQQPQQQPQPAQQQWQQPQPQLQPAQQQQWQQPQQQPQPAQQQQWQQPQQQPQPAQQQQWQQPQQQPQPAQQQQWQQQPQPAQQQQWQQPQQQPQPAQQQQWQQPQQQPQPAQQQWQQPQQSWQPQQQSWGQPQPQPQQQQQQPQQQPWNPQQQQLWGQQQQQQQNQPQQQQMPQQSQNDPFAGLF